MHVGLSALALDSSCPARRAIPRQPQLRQPGYEDEYDFDTVFYDCFADVSGREIIGLCPPLYGLEPTVLPALRTAFIGTTLSEIRMNRLHKSDQLTFPRRSDSVGLSPGVFRQNSIDVQPNHCELFRRKKVLFTLSRNNELAWIRDWVQFHVANHGCNAVLFYDNASTAYGGDDIRKVLASVEGLDVAVVVDWPYRYGPQGGPALVWDSDYCQYGFLEHAHQRFLMFAAGVVSADVDELLITRDRTPIYDILARSRTGYLQYSGTWIENATLAGEGPRRHKDYVHRSTGPGEFFNPKWCVVPARGPFAQWIVHEVVGMPSDPELAPTVTYRHFRAINTNWKDARRKAERPSERVHAVDEELVPWLAVFDRPAVG